jgi:hypothetical protein
MFNLKYLPVAGILRRYSANKIPHIVTRGIEWLLLKNTNESYVNQDEKSIEKYQAEKYNTPLYQYMDEAKFEYKIHEIFIFNANDSVTAIEHMVLVGDVLEGELSNALDEFEKLNESEIENFHKLNFVDEDDKIRYRAGLLKRMLNWIIDNIKGLENYLKWFVFMTDSEETIYKHITERDESKVEIFLHLMMDVDHFFNENTADLKYKSHFDFEEDQINNIQKLNSNHDNLIGFIAFNQARKNCMEIIKKAIEEKGFKGVKFYPPLGYKADGDENYSAEIEALLDYCSNKRIPLFTHCNNQGFEAWPNDRHSGYNSNPKYWEKALKKHPTLILCFGHAGGTEGWFCPNKETDKVLAASIMASDIKDETELQEENWNNSYAALVYKLCVTSDNVYCDASYLDEMINADGSFEPNSKKNFKDRLVKLFTAEPRFKSKIMYGSDWHMLFQEGKNNVYLTSYLELFAEEELISFSDDFFYNNAINYLNLNHLSEINLTN